MGLLDKLTTSHLGLKGETPSQFALSADQSKLHNTYSLDGDPNIPNKPSPSNLDLNGQTPPKYLDNPPQ